MRPTSRRTVLAGLSALAVAPLLVACGDEEEPAAGTDTGTDTGTDASANAAGSDAPEASGFPVTITHKYGETTIESAPQRVVCVGLLEQDSLLALGVAPVGVTYWFGDKELQGVYPWAEDALGDAERPVLLNNTDGIELEKIASLQPDLIIGQYAGLKETEYEKLSALAPTIAQPGEYADFGVPWQEAAVTIGSAVGRKAEIEELVAEVEQRIADDAAAHPEFQGQTAAVVTPYEGLFLYGPEDPRSRMLESLGFTLHPVITGADDSEFGVSLSSERTSDLGDIGVAVWLDLESDPQLTSIWEGTPAAEQGRFFDINEEADGSYYVAHSFVTPLSIPYVLDRYVPQLAAAVDGDVATVPPSSDI